MKSRSRMFLVFIFLAVSILVLDLPTAAEESVQIHFKVKVKCDTPKGEVVCVLINPASASYLDYGIQELKKIGTDTWEGSVNFHKEWLRQTIQYRYCRNYMDPWSDESFNKSNKKGWRYLELTKTVLEVNDVVKKWRWWP
ncbi:MAG: hypothetical protein JW755_06745, partial [Candidatus Aminicenantes bacterium]|nr:hypothetical protein [Candidatus Aminicenantes bacterium]